MVQTESGQYWLNTCLRNISSSVSYSMYLIPPQSLKTAISYLRKLSLKYDLLTVHREYGLSGEFRQSNGDSSSDTNGSLLNSCSGLFFVKKTGQHRSLSVQGKMEGVKIDVK